MTVIPRTGCETVTAILSRLADGGLDQVGSEAAGECACCSLGEARLAVAAESSA